MVPLSTFSPGQQGVIEDVQGDEQSLFRLLNMGFSPGLRVRVMLASPTGDPMVVRLRGHLLSVRRCDAACVHMKEKRR